MSQNVSLRFQWDNHLVIPTSTVTANVLHIMSLNFSIAINFGGDT